MLKSKDWSMKTLKKKPFEDKKQGNFYGQSNSANALKKTQSSDFSSKNQLQDPILS